MRTRSRAGLFLIAPAVLLLVGVVVMPLAVAVTDSLHLLDFSVPHRVGDWVGDAHYRALVRDGGFMASTARSLRFAAAVTALELTLGLPLAFVIFELGPRLRRILESLLLIPLLVAPVMVGLAWLLLLQPSFGVVSWLLDLETPLLASAAVAPWTILFVDAWQWTPFVVLLGLAALQSVPRPLREAAELDGLGRWQRLRAIEWPYLAPVAGVILLLRFLEAFKIYDTVAVLTHGGPGNATEYISLWLTKVAFQENRFGYAAGATLLLDYGVIVASSVLFLLLRSRVERRAR